MKIIRPNNKQQALIGFKKAKTSLESIIRMMEEDEYCIDIMQQNLAVIGLLKSAHERLMNNHLESCFMEGMGSNSTAKKKRMIEEIETIMKIGNK